MYFPKIAISKSPSFMKYLAFALIFFLLSSCNDRPESSKDFTIDIQTTADSLTLLGENIISTQFYERDLAISPTGDEIIYSRGDYKQNKRCLVVLKRENEHWKGPQILNISGKYHDIEPFLANNGDRLYFASNRPIYGDESRDDYNIWYSDRIQGTWADPIALDSVINTRADEFFPSLSRKENLYFTATRNDGMGREDIFMSEFVDGKFQTPIPLPEEINSVSFEFNAYVNPDEDIIIFSSFGRGDGLGGGDLYISRKDSTDAWTRARNLGSLVNSDKLDYSPFVDWKSRNLYFTSERILPDHEKLKDISELEGYSNSTLNGFGNIYKIGFDQLD